MMQLYMYKICFASSTYSRKNCKRECESKFVERHCNCIQYGMPRTMANTSICSQSLDECSAKYMRTIVNNPRICEYCLPSCSEIHYSSSTTSSKLWLTKDSFDYFNITPEYTKYKPHRTALNIHIYINAASCLLQEKHCYAGHLLQTFVRESAHPGPVHQFCNVYLYVG